MRLFLCAIVLCVASDAPGQTLKMPEHVQGKQERKIRIAIESDSKPADWLIAGGTPGEDFDVDEVLDRKAQPSTVTLAFVGYREGVYWLFAVNAKGDVPGKAVCMIVIEPRSPPVPPVPPPPTDPLAKDLAALYAADPGAAKATQIIFLAAVYRAAAGYANDPAIDTADKLAVLVRDARRAKIPDTDLLGVRNRITTEVSAALPSVPGTPMSPELRAKAAQLYVRIALALESVK